MKRNQSSHDAASPPVEPTLPRLSLRELYANAMKEVMADPRKAIAEHDPWLATLLRGPPDAPVA